MKCFIHLVVMSPQWSKLKLYRVEFSSWASSVVLALQQALAFQGAHCEDEEEEEKTQEVWKEEEEKDKEGEKEEEEEDEVEKEEEKKRRKR